MSEEPRPLTLNVFCGELRFQMQAHDTDTVSAIAEQIGERVGVKGQNLTMLVETYHQPLQFPHDLRHYGLQDGARIAVMGSDDVAGDAAAKYSDLQLKRLREQAQAVQKRPVGVVNALNNCYLISSVQALYAIPSIRQRILGYQISSPYYEQLQQLFKRLDNKEDRISIEPFAAEFRKQFTQFQDVSIQHDSQEALLQLETALSPVFVDEPNPFKLITDKEEHLFVKCSVGPEYVSINDCLDEAFKDEKIVQLPSVLQIQFLRVSYSKEDNTAQKITRRVTYPDKINLNQYCDTGVVQREYELLAVIAHKGIGPTTGHYVCYARSNAKWFCFDDANVAVADSESMYGLQGGSMGSFISYVLLYDEVVKK